MKNNKNDIGELAALRADNARLRERLQDLAMYIDGRKAQWAALTDRLQRERNAGADLAVAIRVRDARIAGFARTAARLERRIEGQRREIELLRDRLTRVRSARGAEPDGTGDNEVKVILRAAYDKLTAMRAEQHRLKADLHERDACIDQLCAKLSTLELERTETAAALRRQRRIIDHIETEIRARLARVSSDNRRSRPTKKPRRVASIYRLDEHRARLESETDESPTRIDGRLTLLAATEQPVEYEIGARTVTIGRGAHNDIRIRRKSVSREHARLTPVDGGFIIEDLASRNGIRVNNRRVARLRLRSGDIVSVGRVTFRFNQRNVPLNQHNAS